MILRAPPRGRLQAVCRDVGQLAGQGSAVTVDTSDAAPPSMSRFASMSPSHRLPGRQIPVPGTDRRAKSLESLWEELKAPIGGYRLGERTVDLITARYLIFLPSYLFVLDQLVPDPVLRELLGAAEQGRDVLFYDRHENFDIEDSSAAFSHSAVLAAWFGGDLEQQFLIRRERWLSAYGRAPLPTLPPLALSRYRRLHPR